MRRSLTRRDIRELFSSARRLEARGLKLLFRKNGSASTRFAVVVARGCGGAVKRNREKRITREAYRALKESVPAGFDVVFLVARFRVTLVERRAAMGQLLGRAGLRGAAK